MNVLSILAVIFTGLLAGEEFIVRWGIAPALRTLPDPVHVQVRVALVRRLRVVVPGLIVPAVLTTVAVVALAAPGPAGWAGLGALIVFAVSSALGTVPINMQVIDWDPEDPPSSWRATVARWEAIDVVRSAAAVTSFALLSIAVI